MQSVIYSYLCSAKIAKWDNLSKYYLRKPMLRLSIISGNDLIKFLVSLGFIVIT